MKMETQEAASGDHYLNVSIDERHLVNQTIYKFSIIKIDKCREV